MQALFLFQFLSVVGETKLIRYAISARIGQITPNSRLRGLHITPTSTLSCRDEATADGAKRIATETEMARR
jgi:hypothetical protein